MRVDPLEKQTTSQAIQRLATIAERHHGISPDWAQVAGLFAVTAFYYGRFEEMEECVQYGVEVAEEIEEQYQQEQGNLENTGLH